MIHETMGDEDHEVEEGIQTIGDPRAEKSVNDLAKLNNDCINGSKVNPAFEMDSKL